MQPNLTPEEKARLKTQAQRVFFLMQDNAWWTLSDIANTLNISESGASARLRDFRKPQWGSHTVLCEKWRGNLCKYRLITNGPLLDGKRNTPTAKTEARERLTALLDKSPSFGHIVVYANDLRELLK